MKKKIKSVRTLSRQLAQLRKKNRRARIVFTNGCFDILHAGHVTYLEEAKKQGTHLVVALNADKSVSRLKGPTRPINPLADRATVMAGLGAVDFVTWFEGDTPLEAILSLKPDCLVKGGDWKLDQIVGAREVLGWGGKVRSLKFLEGRSTTSIIKKANKSK